MRITNRSARSLLVRTKETLIVIFGCVYLIAGATSIFARDPDTQHDRILSSAETLFKTMERRDYQQIWRYLSAKSKDTIVKNTYKRMAKHEGGERGVQHSEDQIKQDFTQGGVIAKAYWDGYLGAFDPRLVLDQSKWEMGKADKERAQIIVQHKKAERPAIIQMVLEDGEWKVGLIETFATSKR